MKVAIIGAGIGGLSAAYDLVNAGSEVVIFEAADHVGGLAAGFKEPGWDWSLEEYYHHLFATDEHMLGLLDEIGWKDKLIFPRPITAAYHAGEFYALDSAISVLRFPGVSFPNRVRLGMAVAYLKYLAQWQPLERVTTDAWMRKWVGNEAYEAMWEPLMIGKFGPYYREVNMAWLWARFKARTPRLGTFVGGFQALMDGLADLLRSKGVQIHLNTPLEHIEPIADGGLQLNFENDEVSFDQCLVTTSPALLAHFAPSLAEDYLERLLKLKSMGAVVLILALKYQLSRSGIYWHNVPKAEGFPFLSLVEHTNYVPKEHFGGDHIVYCGDYIEAGHEYFSLTKDELLDRFLPALKRFNPQFEPDWVRATWMFRSTYAQPVPPINHSSAIPDMKTPMDGLWFASMSQVYPWDRGTNFAVEISRKVARQMLEESGK